MLDLVEGRYTNSTRLQTKFGSSNLEKWLDLGDQGTTDPPDLEDRLVELIDTAESFIDDYLRGAVVIGDSVPETIKSIATDLTAVGAYESRGVVDFNPDSGQPYHRLAYVNKRAMDTLAKIKCGEIRLSIDDRIRIIEVVEDDE